MKRTLLDIEGVLTTESDMNRPSGMYGASFTSPPFEPPVGVYEGMDVVTIPSPKLDLNQIAQNLPINPAALEDIIRGPPKESDLGEQLMMQLSPEDEEMLSKLM